MKTETQNFKKSREEIKDIYKDIESAVEMNPSIFIMPIELYNRIMKKLSHMEDRIIKQTTSLMMHIKDKQELRRELKTLKCRITNHKIEEVNKCTKKQ